MFRALTCPSSGDKLYYHSIWYRHSLQTAVEYAGGEQTALQSALLRHALQPFAESDDTRCCDNAICPLKMDMLMLETCRGL